VEAALRRIAGIWAFVCELNEHGWSNGRASGAEAGEAVGGPPPIWSTGVR
jgi:hypothetical protein